MEFSFFFERVKESMLGRWTEVLRFWAIEKFKSCPRKEIYYLCLALMCALVSAGLIFHKFSSLSYEHARLEEEENKKPQKPIRTIEFITEKEVKLLEF